MSLFNKSSAENVDTLPNNTGPITSIVGNEMTVTGNLAFKGKVRVDGTVEGNINGEYLILSVSGKVTGDITASVVVCHGQVDGNMKVKKLFLKKSGVINGRLETADLSVESGGTLNGEIKANQHQDLQLVQGKPEAQTVKAQ